MLRWLQVDFAGVPPAFYEQQVKRIRFIIWCYILPLRLQVDFSSAPLTYYGQQWGSAAASDNGYLVFGDSFYPYDPSTFGNNGDGTPKVS